MTTVDLINMYCSAIRELIGENMKLYEHLKDSLDDEERFGLLQIEEDFLIKMSNYLEVLQKRRNS